MYFSSLQLQLFRTVRKAFLPRATFSSGAPSSTSAADDQPIKLDQNPFEREKTKCILCQHNISPDYKNVKLLSQFQSPYTGRIYGRHITGLCKKKHELVEREITKSQSAGFMGTFVKSVEFFKDPKLFDPERPMRPHKY